MIRNLLFWHEITPKIKYCISEGKNLLAHGSSFAKGIYASIRISIAIDKARNKIDKCWFLTIKGAII